MIVIYAYLLSETARRYYNDAVKEFCDYIRDRNGYCRTEIDWNLGNFAKFISISAKSYDEEDLVWDNAAELVKEMNTFFIKDPVIFSQFEGYRFEDMTIEEKKSHIPGARSGFDEPWGKVGEKPDLEKKPIDVYGIPFPKLSDIVVTCEENKDIRHCTACSDEKKPLNPEPKVDPEMWDDVMKLCEKWYGRDKANS